LLISHLLFGAPKLAVLGSAPGRKRGVVVAVDPDVPGALVAEDRAVDGRPMVTRLELQLEDDSLTGRASDGAGGAREFVGWMGLVAAPGN
jgi:hypothetical protein